MKHRHRWAIVSFTDDRGGREEEASKVSPWSRKHRWRHPERAVASLDSTLRSCRGLGGAGESHLHKRLPLRTRKYVYSVRAQTTKCAALSAQNIRTSGALRGNDPQPVYSWSKNPFHSLTLRLARHKSSKPTACSMNSWMGNRRLPAAAAKVTRSETRFDDYGNSFSRLSMASSNGLCFRL